MIKLMTEAIQLFVWCFGLFVMSAQKFKAGQQQITDTTLKSVRLCHQYGITRLREEWKSLDSG